MTNEIKCEDCGSNMYLQVIKNGVVVEIVKHYSDCPVIKRIIEEGEMHEAYFDSFNHNRSNFGNRL